MGLTSKGKFLSGRHCTISFHWKLSLGGELASQPCWWNGLDGSGGGALGMHPHSHAWESILRCTCGCSEGGSEVCREQSVIVRTTGRQEGERKMALRQ